MSSGIVFRNQSPRSGRGARLLDEGHQLGVERVGIAQDDDRRLDPGDHGLVEVAVDDLEDPASDDDRFLDGEAAASDRCATETEARRLLGRARVVVEPGR